MTLSIPDFLYYRNLFYPNKIKIIPLGIDLESFQLNKMKKGIFVVSAFLVLSFVHLAYAQLGMAMYYTLTRDAAVLEDLLHAKAGSSVNRYPDGNGYYLKRALSETLSVDDDHIIAGIHIRLKDRFFLSRFGPRTSWAWPGPYLFAQRDGRRPG